MGLRGSSSSNQGYVEVKTPGHSWGGICDDGQATGGNVGHSQGMKNANVICRMAGYSQGARRFTTSSSYGHGRSNILLDDLHCTGNENDVFDCPASSVGDHNCSSDEW